MPPGPGRRLLQPVHVSHVPVPVSRRAQPCPDI
jgi:hypothetical protein